MGTFWSETLVAVISATLGAVAALIVRKRGFGAPVVATPEPGTGAPSGPDVWPSRLGRCEQAVCRAFRAVDTMSSTSARQAARTVVRRMEAELPNVRALVELGRSLQTQSRDHEAVRRVREQLDEATVRFGALADQLVEVVRHHVEDPDLDRLHTEVTALRGRFPLLRPLSAVLESPAERPLAQVPA